MDGIKERRINKSILVAIYIFCATQVLVLVQKLMQYNSEEFKPYLLNTIPKETLKLFSQEQINQSINDVFILFNVIVFGMFFTMAYIIFEIYRGKNWARIMMAISVVLSSLYFVIFFATHPFIFPIHLLSLGVVVGEIAGVILLYKKENSCHFKPKK
ncbi:MAG: hypothetical protein CR967_02345 [Proteobacteria bacterium]|nr:MAG: hypothetical protein CR967_02345 [Pseudomonadota bacterium]